MQNAVTDFLLTPDGSSSRRVRKMLAAEAPGLYRMAGSWAELLSQAQAAYLLPPENPSWSEKLAECAARQSEAFWSASLEVAPEETLAELDAALQRLIEGAGPKADWPAFINKLPQLSRLHTRFGQLSELLRRIDTLPEAFRLMEAVIHAAHPPLRPLRVHSLPDLPTLNAWQQAVLHRLAADAPPPDSELQDLLARALEPAGTSNPSLLAARALYRPLDTPARPNHSLRVLSARDRLEEIEVAAGMIQKFIGRGGRPEQYGILLPADAFTLQTVETVFNQFGLPLSGLQRSPGERDLGKEAVRLLLLGLRRPAPVMSIAALLTSPLMPWSTAEGQDYAQAVMDGDVLLKDKKLDDAPRRLMDMLDAGADRAEHLQQHLASFRRLLESGEGLFDHRRRALACIDELLPALPDMNEPDWDALLSKAKPQPIHTAAERSYWKEAVAVFHEGCEPWRTVEHLVVIGFNEGHFPAGGRASAVFTEAEWEAIAELGWAVPTAESKREQQRALFARQMAAAAESLTLLFSRRAADGKPLEPSSSLVFLARRFGTEPDNLVLELSRREDREQIARLATAAPKKPVPPRQLPAKDLELQIDLLQAFGPAPDKPASLSPSAADTLMVSPFAWLLGRLGCEPRQWTTDQLDPMTAGTLAHRVFEHLFPAGKPLISVKAIARQAPVLLNQFTLQLAPFLRSPDWRVERLKLETEIVTAAVRWRQLLASWNAEIIGSEQWLQGNYNGIALRGQSDLLLQLPAGKVLVVDYKKSSSFKRRRRMRSRFDLQAHLYRLMIQSGGLPAPAAAPADVGVLYYLLNDQTALSDSAISADGTVPGLEVIDADISSAAMEHLERRLDEIRSGKVRLNTTADEDWWDKNAGIRLYALDNSPLLRLFMHQAEVAP